MTKTIEDSAKRFADMKTTKQAGSSVERDKKALLMTQFFHYALEELPLSERLTAEEKERVKGIYNAEKEHVQFQMKQANASMNQMCRSWHNQLKEGSYAKLRLLESIFGKELFERKEEE